MVAISKGRNNRTEKLSNINKKNNKNKKNKRNNKDQKKTSIFDAIQILFKEGSSKGLLEYTKNYFISSYDQRKTSFGKKLGKGLISPMNIITIVYKIIKLYFYEKKSIKETSKEVAYECVKNFLEYFYVILQLHLWKN